MAVVRFLTAKLLVKKARAERGRLREDELARVEWFIPEVLEKIDVTMESRARFAAEFLRSQVVKNISQPVKKGTGPRGGLVVVDRSRPGEYPKLDTGQLSRSIVSDVWKEGKTWNAGIGTTLKYGMILELRMDRSFLRRTMEEESARTARIMTGPIT